ncbi:MAG: CoA-binding protein [Treponema sp.]|jgi:redox-sensing transcriptional repressor|nr:CoA-binding protein [Treponema sp.]
MRILEDSGKGHLTSAQIEGLTGWPSHTIRKDISFLGIRASGGEAEGAGGPGGKAGSQGGYSPALLAPAIRKALSLDRRRKFCILGLGRLGSAYLGLGAEGVFEPAGAFELVAGFDISVNRVEILRSPVPLYPAYKMGEVIGRFGIEIALLCVPPEAAQGAAEKLAAAGIRGILNFAPLALMLPPEIAVRNVYLEDELCALAIHMST